MAQNCSSNIGPIAGCAWALGRPIPDLPPSLFPHEGCLWRMASRQDTDRALVRWDSSGVTLEFAGELLGDAIAQCISEHQHVHMTIVVCLYVGGPVFLESGDDLIGREGQVLPKH